MEIQAIQEQISVAHANRKKVFIKTFGCQMNEYDSQRMLDLLKDAAFDATQIAEEADLIILNTCSIRDKAQEKVFDDLGRIRQLKQKNPSLIIAVGGCVASQEGGNIIKRAHYVDIVFGPQTLHRLPEMIAQKEKTQRRQVDISFPEIEKFDRLPTHSSQDGASAFVSIMEGCSQYCSYCVVPYTRGEEISRPVDDILFEIANLVDNNGVKEITLLGQNVNAYYGALHNGEKVDFAFLLEVIDAIPGLQRIRYTTSHPKSMTNRLIDCYGKLEKLVSHLHLPVQSGSDRILSAMKRGYTVLEYKSIVRRLRAVRPDICLSSDFIVGFPGETREDFQKTVDLVESLKFDFSFTFIFSKRPGTPAAQLPCSLTQEEKVLRLQQLQTLLQQEGMRISNSMVDSVQNVLVEGQSKRNPEQLSGRTDNNRIVHFDGPPSLIKTIIPIKITEALPHCLRGTWLNDTPDTTQEP